MRRSTGRDVMATSVLSVPIDAPFAEVARVLFAGGVRAVPVLDPDGMLLGVVSEGDLLATAERGDPLPGQSGPWQRLLRRWHAGDAGRPGATTAGELMTTPVTTIEPGATVAHAARCMREHRLGWLPVVDDHGRMVGVLGRSDLLGVFSRPDAEVRDEVADEVFGRMLLVDPRRVDIAVDRGVVTLCGQLDTRADTELAVRFVERLEGVVAVVDRLTYRFDERLADTDVAPLA
jgi:CBS-domain-containing membrane protein